MGQYNTGVLKLRPKKKKKKAFLLFPCQVGNFKPFKGALVQEGLVVSRPERRCKGHRLTCPASCAAPWTAGTPGTATRRPGSRRAPAAGRTGGRLCYTRHTGSACRPHLGECNIPVPERCGLAPPEKRKLPQRWRSGQSERKMLSAPCERGTFPLSSTAAAETI